MEEFRELYVEAGGGTKCLCGASESDKNLGIRAAISRTKKKETSCILPSNIPHRALNPCSDLFDSFTIPLGNVGTTPENACGGVHSSY